MDSVELYRQLLGLTPPWTVERVELDVARQHVEVYVGHPAGQRFGCPECGRELGAYDHLAERVWRHAAWATYSRLAPMIEAAKLIARHLQNVLTYFTHRITNAVAEGLNSKIATVQKRACGYRNPDNFKIAVYFHCGSLNLYPTRLP